MDKFGGIGCKLWLIFVLSCIYGMMNVGDVVIVIWKI